MPRGHEFDETTIAGVLEQLQLVFANKYWVVQCKYSELIARLNYAEIEWHVGEDERHVIEVSFQCECISACRSKECLRASPQELFQG